MIFNRTTIFPFVISCFIFISCGYADDTPVDKDKPKSDKLTLPLTAVFDLTTNYVFRGISQTNNIAAVQGGITYTLPHVGAYASIWGSNVKYPDIFGNTATLELDTTIGISHTWDDFTLQLSLVRYNYPQTVGVAYNEFIANAQYSVVTGLIGYTNDIFGFGEHGTYYNIGLNWDIPEKYAFGITNMNLTAGFGHYSLPNNFFPSYDDYLIQFTKTIGPWLLALGWTDTNLQDNRLADNKVIFTVSVSIE